MADVSWWDAVSDISSDSESSSPSPLLPVSRRLLGGRLSKSSAKFSSGLKPEPRFLPKADPDSGSEDGWQPSPASKAWIDGVTLNGMAYEMRRQQDVRAGARSLGLFPKPAAKSAAARSASVSASRQLVRARGSAWVQTAARQNVAAGARWPAIHLQ